tara:strand:- start:508 stop:837 length:330 start_codon:yes stop_codon:yes gene_type:complete
MNEMLDGFLKAAQNKDDALDIKALLSKDEQIEWEVLVKAMDSIDIMHIGACLEKVSKTYQLKKWQEMSILAYIKVLEIMVKAAKEASPESFKAVEEESEKPTYTGSMFG